MLLEVLLGLMVLLIGVGATVASISSFARLDESNRETTIAYIAARQAIEGMQGQPFRQVFPLFNATNVDDPAGFVPGSGFAVPGLNVQQGDPDGLVGRIIFPSPAGAPATLVENVVDATFGLPRDLNADGAIDGDDHSGDYVALPVRVRIEWRGATGNRAIEIQTLLVPR